MRATYSYQVGNSKVTTRPLKLQQFFKTFCCMSSWHGAATASHVEATIHNRNHNEAVTNKEAMTNSQRLDANNQNVTIPNESSPNQHDAGLGVTLHNCNRVVLRVTRTNLLLMFFLKTDLPLQSSPFYIAS